MSSRGSIPANHPLFPTLPRPGLIPHGPRATSYRPPACSGPLTHESLVRLRLYRRQACPVDALPAEVDAPQRQLGVRSAFYLHPGLAGAVTFGLRRPAVLLPASFPSMEPGLRAAVACHELWHVRRRDWLWTLAEEVLRAFFWFHPFVLRLLDRIRLTREQIVDALTVRATGSRERYIQALLETAAARAARLRRAVVPQTPPPRRAALAAGQGSSHV